MKATRTLDNLTAAEKSALLSDIHRKLGSDLSLADFSDYELAAIANDIAEAKNSIFFAGIANTLAAERS